MERNRLKHTFVSGLVLSLLTVICITNISWGQPLGQITINYIEAVADPDQYGNKVRAYVTVSSSDQNTIPGLSQANFNVKEDGREVDIRNLSQTEDPMSIVLAIDTSGSMQAQDKSGLTSMQAAKDAAVAFISMLGSNDQVALYSFNNDTNFHLDFTIDHEAAIAAVKGLKAKYRAATRLYDTALEAVKKASEIPRGRRALILLTDGKDEKGDSTCSIHSSNDIIDAATTKTIRVPIYTMGVGPNVDAKELARMASLTGGRSMLAASLTELSDFYRILATQLKNQYMVEYITRSPSGEHSLIIKVNHENTVEQDEKRFWSPPLPVAVSPTVNIISPGDTDQVKDSVDVKIEITPDEGISKVRFYVDAALKEEDSNSPFEGFSWDTKGLHAGLHILRIEAIHVNGQTGSAEITIKTASPVQPPAHVPAEPEAEKKSGIPFLMYGIIILILVFVLCCIFYIMNRSKKNKQTAKESIRSRVTKAPGEPAITRRKPPPPIEDEATTMDIQEYIEPMAKLTVLQSLDMDLGATFKVIGTTEIGRGSENKVKLPDKPVSRKHAVIYCTDNSFFIRDLNSSYGTVVDGKKVTSAGINLYDGAKIQLGPRTVLEFNILVMGGKNDEGDKTKVYK